VAVLCPGLFPALESLFRLVPPAASVHAAAAELVAALLPLHASELWQQPAAAEGRVAVASLLTTLRKFAARCAGCGLSGPDREEAAAVAATVLAMLSTLLAEAQSALGNGGEGSLATIAAAQLLPGAQVRAGVACSPPRAAPAYCAWGARCVPPLTATPHSPPSPLAHRR
jgi:hypothetical protein